MNKQDPATSTEDLSIVLETIISNNHKAMLAFNNAMCKREELSLRIGKRTTHILRFGVVSVFLISSLMFFLIQSLSKNIDNMSNNMARISTIMDNMDNSFTVVTHHLKNIDNTMGGLSTHTKSMSRDIHGVPQMVVNMNALQSSVKNMDTSMNTMSGDVHVLNQNTAGINQQFSILRQHMGIMTYDINRISKPMKFFPF